MKTSSKIVAIAFVLMMIAVPFMAADESSAATDAFDKISVTKKFTDNDNGVVEISFKNLNAGTTYVIHVVNEDKSHYYASSEFTPSSDKHTVSISWRFDNSGHMTVFFVLQQKEGEVVDTEGGYGIDVSHSIWKDWTTYVAIIIVVLLIILAAYLKLRGGIGSGSGMKKTKKFSELEASKNTAASTEKKMFFSSRQQQQTAEAPKEIPKEEPKAPAADTTSTEKQTYSPGRGFFKNRKQ